MIIEIIKVEVVVVVAEVVMVVVVVVSYFCCISKHTVTLMRVLAACNSFLSPSARARTAYLVAA